MLSLTYLLIYAILYNYEYTFSSYKPHLFTELLNTLVLIALLLNTNNTNSKPLETSIRTDSTNSLPFPHFFLLRHYAIADVTIRPATNCEKLNGKDNYKTQAVRIKSNLQGQGLQRYTDLSQLRACLLQRPAQVVDPITGAKYIAAKSDDDYKDRVDKYKSKVQKSHIYILDNCTSWIAEQCAEAYDIASTLQAYLIDQYNKQGISQEYSTYLKQLQLQYNGRELNRFCEEYQSKLLKLNKIEDFKVSNKQSLFFFLSLVREYYLQFIANIRQDLRKTETTSATTLLLVKCIADLLNKHTAQTNKGTSSTVLIAVRKNGTLIAPTQRPARVDNRANLKYTYCNKTRYIESECYQKYPKKKAAFKKIIAEKKALQQQQKLLKAALAVYVTATETPVLALLPALKYDFITGQMLIAVVRNGKVPLLLEYTFELIAYTNIADQD